MKEYPEINCLKNYFKKHTIEIKKLPFSANSGFVLIEFYIGSKSWKIFVDDEYKDFSVDNQLMCLFLTLSSLEAYFESTDYLVWCKQNGLNASDLNWREYYKSLETIYLEIKKELGDIDPCISSYDYHLRTDIIDSLASGNFLIE